VLDPALAQLVESWSGGRIVRAQRAGTGASRVTWLIDAERAGQPLALVLRCDANDGPLSGTELTLEREATVYGALMKTGVRIPRLVAVATGGGALLLERAPGSDAFAAVADPAVKQAIADDYFTALSELHTVDPAELWLPGFERPRDPRDHARADLRLWRRIAAARLAGSDPLLDTAFDWLDANAPATAARASLCHGDAGPGNFLFEGSRVTALLDWEFAHLGDPHDDLAWVAVRAQLLGGFGDLARGYRTWSAATGLRADRARIEFYRALVLTRMAVSCRIALSHAGPRSRDTTVYALLLPYLRALLPEALARAGCPRAQVESFDADGRAGIDAQPLLRAHARPLDELPAA
jgi:aminoglycoside phosphotransferase (APT) family kinase protein